MVPDCSYPMSDVRDVALLHVKALLNTESNGQRFIATTAESFKFVEIARVLQQNGYDKVSPKVAPSFLLKLVSLFDSEVRGMRAFLGARITADTEPTQRVFDWQAIEFKKTVLDTAASIGDNRKKA